MSKHQDLAALVDIINGHDRTSEGMVIFLIETRDSIVQDFVDMVDKNLDLGIYNASVPSYNSADLEAACEVEGDFIIIIRHYMIEDYNIALMVGRALFNGNVVVMVYPEGFKFEGPTTPTTFH